MGPWARGSRERPTPRRPPDAVTGSAEPSRITRARLSLVPAAAAPLADRAFRQLAAASIATFAVQPLGWKRRWRIGERRSRRLCSRSAWSGHHGADRAAHTPARGAGGRGHWLGPGHGPTSVRPRGAVRRAVVERSGGLLHCAALAASWLRVTSSRSRYQGAPRRGPGAGHAGARRPDRAAADHRALAWSRGAVRGSFGVRRGAVAFVTTPRTRMAIAGEVPAMLLAIYQYHRFVRGWNASATIRDRRPPVGSGSAQGAGSTRR